MCEIVGTPFFWWLPFPEACQGDMKQGIFKVMGLSIYNETYWLDGRKRLCKTYLSLSAVFGSSMVRVGGITFCLAGCGGAHNSTIQNLTKLYGWVR